MDFIWGVDVISDRDPTQQGHHDYDKLSFFAARTQFELSNTSENVQGLLRTRLWQHTHSLTALLAYTYFCNLDVFLSTFPSSQE